MDEQSKLKIETYAGNAFKAAHTENHRAAEHEMKAARNKLAAKGRAGANVLYELVPIRAKEIKQDVMALALNTMDAYSLYEVPLEDSILEEVHILYNNSLSAAIESLAKEPVVGTPPGTGPEEQLKNIVRQQLVPYVGGLMSEISCELERRKITQKKKVMEIGHVITFNAGDNARLNLNSIDQSTNTVTVSEDVFVQMPNRDQIGSAG